MERLTTKNEHRQRDFREYMPNWDAICNMTGSGTHDYTFALKVSLDKLGQYEDTGLTPEDVVAMYRTIEQVKLPLWKIRELADAEDEGRLVKLPKYDAIPVDWIINYAAVPCVDKDGEKYLTFERNCIDTMLEEWRKLNEGQ